MGHQVSDDSIADKTPKCRCGDPIKQVDLYAGPFGTKSGPRYGWQHVEKYRNFSHQARLDWEALANE